MLHCLQEYFIHLHRLFISSCFCTRLHLEELPLYEWIDELTIGVHDFPSVDDELVATGRSITVWSCERLEILRIVEYECRLYQLGSSCLFVDVIEEIGSSDSSYLLDSDVFCDLLQLLHSVREHIDSSVFSEQFWESTRGKSRSEVYIDHISTLVHHLHHW